MDDTAIRKADTELEKLRTRLDASEREIAQDAARITRLLEEDCPAYLRRELKARFVAAPEFAERMSAETLARLKREIDEQGRQAGTEIAAALRDHGLWLIDVADSEGALELRDIPEVWRRLARIESVLEGFLGRYGFPTDGSGGHRVEYRPPTWFVSGVLLKTLLETYRAHVGERSRLKKEIETLETERRRSALELKWEAAR